MRVGRHWYDSIIEHGAAPDLGLVRPQATDSTWRPNRPIPKQYQ